MKSDDASRQDDKLVSLEERRQLRNAPERMPDFAEVLRTEDDLGAVIRAHLYTEYALGKILGDALTDENVRYGDRVRLANKHKLISDAEKNMLFELDSLRNKFAHQWDYKITPRRMMYLINALDLDTRDSFDDLFRCDIGEYDLKEREDLFKQSPETLRYVLRTALYLIYRVEPFSSRLDV